MKKIHYLFGFAISILLLAPISLQGKKKDKVKHPIAGVWQQVQTSMDDNKSASMLYYPHFKILNSDGTFFNLACLTPNKPAILTQGGTYEILSDSSYVEKIVPELSRNAKAWDSPMKYLLSGKENKFLIVQWYNETFQKWIPELWMRVEVPFSKDSE